MNKIKFKSMGGKWLFAARSWLQWNTINGDDVIWSSNDIIKPPLTVKQIEDLAGDVAYAAVEEYKKIQKRQS